MNQLQSYLYERVFDFGTEMSMEQNKYDFWVKMLGKELTQELCENDLKVKAYMSEYSILNIQKKDIHEEEVILSMTKATMRETATFLDEQIQKGTFAEFYLIFLAEGYELLKRKVRKLQNLESVFKKASI